MYDHKGGYSGIVFRYVNEKEYYLLEFHKNKIELRKKSGDDMTVVDTDAEWVTE